MPLDLVFNELSFKPLAENKGEAQKRITQFIEILVSASKAGVKGSFRTVAEFSAEPIATNYSIKTFLSESRRFGGSERTQAEFLLSFVNRKADIPLISPYDADLSDNDPVRQARLQSEFRFQDVEARGLGYAYSLDALAISLASATAWNTTELMITVTELAEDVEDVSIYSHEEKVRNASRDTHISELQQWITDRRLNEVSSGHDLISRQSQLFKYVKFCHTAEDQVSKLRANELRPLLRYLTHVDVYFSERNTIEQMPLRQLGVNISRESDATLQNPYLRQQREFKCPDGETRLFSWHLKYRLEGNPRRVYVYPLPETRELLVGYVGPHLDTARHT
jgi:hypothetical protein